MLAQWRFGLRCRTEVVFVLAQWHFGPRCGTELVLAQWHFGPRYSTEVAPLRVNCQLLTSGYREVSRVLAFIAARSYSLLCLEEV